jgi:hypothetical protein
MFQMVFMQPLILSGLIVLPALWYLLRITPPAPKTIFFPATPFLKGLVSDEQTPSHTPWWLLILRLLIGALIIISLAKPVINPASSLSGKGGVRIILDNSWASAQIWETQINTAEEIITQAAREGRGVYILPTTSSLGETNIIQHGPMAQSAALSLLRGMTPNPWPADYEALKKALKDIGTSEPIHSIWLSHGLDEGNLNNALNTIQNQGSLKLISPSVESLPLLLRPTKQTMTRQELKNGDGIRIDIDAPKNIATALPVSVQALAQRSDILDVVTANLTADDLPHTVTFDILEDLKDKISRFQIAGRKGAGATFLLDDDFKKRKVGIVGTEQSESNAPLIDDTYYIKRAIEPIAVANFGIVQELIDKGVSIIIMPDTGAMPTETLNALEGWISGGGLLLRFSGPHLAEAQNEQFLLPVILRSGGRSLSGSLSWDKPQRIAPFDEDSPFYGLDAPEDISITQQVLADPEQNLDGKVWARLSDGTPFITALQRDKGLIVLVHTTANADWSNFALSGLYVSVLKRIIRLAGQDSVNLSHDFATLDPLLIMNGFGNLVSPSGAVQPLIASEAEKFAPSSLTPPGLYGSAQTQLAFNIGSSNAVIKLTAISSLPSGVIRGNYAQDYEVSLAPLFLYAAACLFCLDWLIMIFAVGSGAQMLKHFSRKTSIFFVFMFLLLGVQPAIANNNSDLQYANGFYLAHIKTGDTALDNTTHTGLESLSRVLSDRTSVEPVGIVLLDPESDTLAFFPIIFWPISANQKAYSDKAMKNIQSYLDHGGTIVFDTRDQNRSTQSMINTDNAKALRSITSSLDIPPIAPINKNHVLGRTFYLLEEFPGRYDSGTLWVERISTSGRDNVSSVIIGSNDWFGSWADSYNEQSINRYIGGNGNPLRRQREMSLRFGVNLIMYALTGNYKTDQVHIEHILRRLGQ